MELTIFEINLDGAQFNAPFAGEDETDGADDAGEDDDDQTGPSVPRGFDPRPVLVIAVLLGMALLARYLRSDEDGDLEIEADEIEIEES